MRVRATKQGFLDGRHIDPGTIFDVDEKFYAGNETQHGWMEKIIDPVYSASKPTKKEK